MSEERREGHPEEPAEGAEEDVAPRGAERASEGRTAGNAEEGSSEHPEKPAEGADEDVAPRGAEHSGTGG